MNIELKEITTPILDDILPLYADAEWTNYTSNPNMLTNAYHNSLKIIGAYDSKQLVGIIRVVGDGHSIIYIQDIIVLKSHQRNGIGKMLLQSIMEHYSHVYQKVLLTDNQPKTVSFYQSLGFTPDTELGCISFVHFTL